MNADALGFFDEVFALMHGVKEDGSVWEKAAELFGGGEATENRHGEVEDDEVGPEFYGFVDGIAAVGNLGADFEVGARKQNQAHTLTYGVVVVSNKDANQGNCLLGDTNSELDKLLRLEPDW